jgi:hypothetical protein
VARRSTVLLLLAFKRGRRGRNLRPRLGQPACLSTGSGALVAVIPELAGPACAANAVNYRPGTPCPAFLGQSVTLP